MEIKKWLMRNEQTADGNKQTAVGSKQTANEIRIERTQSWYSVQEQ